MAFLQDKTKNIKMPKMPAMPGAKKTTTTAATGEGGKTAREESKKESASFSKQTSGIAASFVSNVTPR